MNDEKKILRPVVQSDQGHAPSHADFIFWCPGCKCGHGVWTTKTNTQSAVWSFNGNLERPTFSPSILITYTRDITDDERARILGGEKLHIPQMRCHLFVVDGQLQYCPDCTHELAGRTVAMVPF